jgi:hypothetical protein
VAIVEEKHKMGNISTDVVFKLVSELSGKGASTGDIFKFLSSNGLANKGVTSIFGKASSTSDVLKSLSGMGDVIPDTSATGSALSFDNIGKTLSDGYDRAGFALGTAASIGMLGNTDEIFNSEQYKKVFDDISPTAPTSGLSQTGKFDINKSPYERVKISQTQQKVNPNEIKNLMPKTSLSQVYQYLQVIAQSPNEQDKIQQLNAYTKKLQQELQPLNNYISKVSNVPK